MICRGCLRKSQCGPKRHVAATLPPRCQRRPVSREPPRSQRPPDHLGPPGSRESLRAPRRSVAKTPRCTDSRGDAPVKVWTHRDVGDPGANAEVGSTQSPRQPAALTPPRRSAKRDAFRDAWRTDNTSERVQRETRRVSRQAGRLRNAPIIHPNPAR